MQNLDQWEEVILAPLTILTGDTIWVADCIVALVFTDDPATVVAGNQPLGDLVEVQFACAHLSPWLWTIAAEIFVVNVVHEMGPFIQCGDDIHSAADDVADVRCPTSHLWIKAAQDDIIIFLRANDGGWRAVWVIGAFDAHINGALGNSVDVASDV